ncbi:hypothetical protein pb186bvf_020801 [Paramecium bursaria]
MREGYTNEELKGEGFLFIVYRIISLSQISKLSSLIYFFKLSIIIHLLFGLYSKIQRVLYFKHYFIIIQQYKIASQKYYHLGVVFQEFLFHHISDFTINIKKLCLWFKLNEDISFSNNTSMNMIIRE